MKKNALFIFLALLALTVQFGCNSQASTNRNYLHDIDTSSFLTIPFDPGVAFTDESHTLSTELFDSVTFIPLETTKESRFANIDQLEITDEYFIMFDKTTSSILFFTKNGDFVRKISGTRTGYFALNRPLKQITIRNYDTAKEWRIYDFNGNLIQKSTIPFEFGNFTYLDNNRIAFNRTWSYSNVDKLNGTKYQFSNLIISDTLANVSNDYFSYDTTALDASELYSVKKIFFNNGKNINYLQPFDFNVYSFDKNSLIKKYEFVFPEEYSLPKDFLYNPSYLGDRKKFLEKHNRKVYAVTDFYRVHDNVYFSVKAWSYSQSYTYNLKTKTFVNFFNIGSMKDVSFMPLGYAFLAADTNSIYTTMPSSYLIKRKFLNGKQLSDNEYPVSLQRLFNYGGNLDNPVLIRLYPK